MFGKVALCLFIAFVALGVGLFVGAHNPADSTVSTFNDGYSTAMQDACQQGSVYACDWLKSNH